MMGIGPESQSITATKDDNSTEDDSVEVKSEDDGDATDRKDAIRFGESDVDSADEKTPLLVQSHADGALNVRSRPQASIARRLASAIVGTFRIVISAVLAPGRYLIACFFDEQGHFSAAMPVYKIARKISREQRRAGPEHTPTALASNQSSLQSNTSESLSNTHDDEKASAMSESDADSDTSRPNSTAEDSPSQNTRSKSTTGSVTEESDASASKRPTRIKIVSQEELRRRKQRRSQASSLSQSSQEPLLTVDSIKSPTSASSSFRLDKYPRAPAPPRPLVPRRQPSYSTITPIRNVNQKTLVIDLDETLIHSMAKGGRMSTGHMVEVKLSSPIGHAGNVIGPQVPILYYVHKRPHCDEFLRKVSKWYNLIVFTASVQEYADPVIDWLELERKYFSARYYRQHCTYRNGAYIKDLSQVEPDLSKVMILDNSPMSYIFHEDNAIPIEGWISDPTDNDLLHLIPLFEGLQYTTDVRALLALRLGESIS